MTNIRWGFFALTALLVQAATASAAATWGVDLGNSSVVVDGDTYADNGANGFAPGGAFDLDDPLPVIAFTPNFVVGADTFDLGATLNPVSVDDNPAVPFDTSASAVGVVTIDGLGSSTLEIRWRANTLNDTFGGDGFLTDSSALLLSSIEATINGVGPGTPVEILYDWEYFATAVPDHEAVAEDPETATGSLTFFDDQGMGPGNVFNVAVGEPGVLTQFDNDSGTYSLNTSNPLSSLSVVVDATSDTRMDSPGTGAFQEDLAGSEFVGRLTLTLRVVPEPTSVVQMLLGVLAVPLTIGRHRQPEIG